MTLSRHGFDDLAEAIAKLNKLDAETAREYAALIGDTPQLDEDGLVVVMRDGKELARVVLPSTLKR